MASFMNQQTDTRWSKSTRILHWLSAVFILGLFALGLWMRSLGYYHAWYQEAPQLHKSFGILLILIYLVRLLSRLLTKAPAALNTHKPWEVTATHITHNALYIGIGLILISGYLIASADNRPIGVFELFDIPVIFTAFEQQEDWAGAFHEWGAYILMCLVALHIMGALKHHFMDKDHTLKRML